MAQEVQVADHQVVAVPWVVMVLTTQVVVEVEIIIMDLVDLGEMVLLPLNMMSFLDLIHLQVVVILMLNLVEMDMFITYSINLDH